MDTYTGNDLLIGTGHHNRVGVIASGQNLTRGAVLGIDADGKYSLSATASSDGTQVPVAILAVDTDASDGDVNAAVYFSGEFNSTFCTFGAGHDVATVDAAFARAASPMHVRDVT